MFPFVIQMPMSSLSIIFGNSKVPVSHQNSSSKMGVGSNFLKIVKIITHNFGL